MILRKKLTAKEVLEIVIVKASESIPEHIKGNIEASYDDDGVEVVFTERLSKENIS